MTLTERVREIANERMRLEILPQLSMNPQLATDWNPLEIQIFGKDWSLELKPEKDSLAVKILADAALYEQTQTIVAEATHEAILSAPGDFVSGLLDYIMSDGSA